MRSSGKVSDNLSTLMSLRQIKYFVAVAKTGSLSAGARRSNVSQPSLCVQIKQLEERVGATLLSRNSRGVELTAAGKVFLPHAIAVLEEVRQGERAVALVDSRNAKEISLGVMPTPCRALAVDLLHRCKEGLGGSSLRFHEGLSSDLSQLFADGELDATFCYDAVPIKTATILSLYQEELYLVGPPQILKSVGDVSRASLNKFSLVLGDAKRSMRGFIESTLFADGINLKVAFEIASTHLKRELLCRQGCCSIVSHGLFWDEINLGKLCARRIKPPLIRTVFLMIHESMPAKTRELFESLIRSVVKDRIEEKKLGWRTI